MLGEQIMNDPKTIEDQRGITQEEVDELLKEFDQLIEEGFEVDPY